MKVKPIVKNTHDIKNNGYQMLDKLHKITKSKNLVDVFNRCCGDDTYCFLYCQGLFEFISEVYKEMPDKQLLTKFQNKSDNFLIELKESIQNNNKINKKLLSSYLKFYTKFFNKVIEQGIQPNITNSTLEFWNKQCVLAYLATWNVK